MALDKSFCIVQSWCKAITPERAVVVIYPLVEEVESDVVTGLGSSSSKSHSPYVCRWFNNRVGAIVLWCSVRSTWMGL